MTKFQVSVAKDDSSTSELAVLRVASASKNSQSQFFPEHVRVTATSLVQLNRKVLEKLKLHRIDAVTLSLTLKLANDKTLVFTDVDRLVAFDSKIDSLTSLISLKWQFVFNYENEDHLHSIYLRISDRPNPAMLFQKAMSLSSDDMESFDREGVAPVSCRVDFFDGRFSNELLTLVAEWVAALPRAEPTFGFVKWLDDHEESIGTYVVGVTPAVTLAALAGIWVAFIPQSATESMRLSVAWLTGTAICYLLSRYIAYILMRVFAKNISRMNAVPVFDITSGDQQKMVKFLAKSHKSLIIASITAVAYGLLKGIGLWLASYLTQIKF